MKTLAALCALSFAVLVAKVVVADAPPPPPLKPCATDADCPGCERCSNGFCPGGVAQLAICMCNAECQDIGFGACDLSPDKPLCGGRCVGGTPQRELVCGAGDDVVKVEALATPTTDVPDAVKVAAETKVSVTLLGAK